MNDKPLKKSYKLFILWMVLFCGIIMAMSFLMAEVDEHLMIRIVDCSCMVFLCILMLIIYKTEYVYWFNGITYEQAVTAGSSRRKRYARIHLVSLTIISAVLILYSIISAILHFHYIADVTVMIVLLLGWAIFSIRIKL